MKQHQRRKPNPGRKPHARDMDRASQEQYLAEVRKEYHGADKQHKSRLLDEAEKRTGLNRKHLIVKMGQEESKQKTGHRKRKRIYDSAVTAVLVKIWMLFEYMCGQRLAPLLRQQVDSLRRLGEIRCPNEVAEKLKRLSARTIDRLLSRERQRLQLNRYRNPSLEPLLHQQVPVKTSAEWDRQQVGNVQIDLVLHCGQSGAGHYVHTLSVAEIASGWWEAEAMLGRSQQGSQKAFQAICERLPFAVREVHPDNDRCLLHDLLYQYCRQHQIRLSRSRPLKKNDNAWVEQRNWSHVRKVVGYRRLESQAERDTLQQIHGVLALFRNFFQPTMKLVEKLRVGGKIHRRYEEPKTPYQRLMESGQLDAASKKKLKSVYESLNPAELKRRIEQNLTKLFQFHEERSVKPRRIPTRRMAPHLVRSFMTQPRPLWLGS